MLIVLAFPAPLGLLRSLRRRQVHHSLPAE
jgi:hypothetical protein